MNDAFWDELLKVRGEVNKVIEQARADKKVGGSLEAAVTLYAVPELSANLTALATNYDLSVDLRRYRCRL
ncbi:hypothetical protein ACNKHL_00190 [Shigella flexneri]